MKKSVISVCLIMSMCFIPTLNSQTIITETDKITLKKILSTPWQYTYEYLRNNSFRFRETPTGSVTFDFRYRSPEYIFVDKDSTIVFNFEDGSNMELYALQNTVYMPYLMGNTKYYDIDIMYKLRDENDLNNFRNKSITSIVLNYRTYEGEKQNEIIISKKRGENLKGIYSLFVESVKNK